MKYIVIGGVAGGATAAARIRRNTEQAEIILFEKGEYISYANCGLPYYIGGVIAEREKLFVQTPEAFGKRFNIDVRTRSEVIAIHSAEKTVDIRTSDGKTYTESYDKLLLSPGASPVRPPLPGIDNEGIFTLRNVNDTDAIKSYLQQHKVKRAVIIGAGFIGLEMAENLQEAGAEVAVVEMANQVMAPIDFSMASLVHEHLLQKGVHLYLEKAPSGLPAKTAAFLNLWLKKRMPFRKALAVFHTEKPEATERKLLSLLRHQQLSTAELIQCMEKGSFHIRNSRQLMEQIYAEETSDCDSIVTEGRTLEIRRPVLTAVANLYLKQLITLQIL